jgi:hypothetical protein
MEGGCTSSHENEMKHLSLQEYNTGIQRIKYVTKCSECHRKQQKCMPVLYLDVF